MRHLKSFLYLVSLLFLFGCISTSTPNSAKSVSGLSLQQANTDCKYEAKNIFHMIGKNQSGVYRGSLKRDLNWTCINSK